MTKMDEGDRGSRATKVRVGRRRRGSAAAKQRGRLAAQLGCGREGLGGAPGGRGGQRRSATYRARRG